MGVARRVLFRGAFLTGGVGAVALCTVVWSEVIHARSTGRRLGTARVTPGSRGAVVVLGFADSGRRANAVNRWRARIALRSVPAGTDTTIVVSGGSVRGPVPEAVLLAKYLRDELGWNGPLVVESASTSTWENVRNVIPVLDAMDWIVFASNSLHAEKAREYLWRQRHDLGSRVVRGEDHRWGEMFHVKPAFAIVGLWKLRALR